MNYYILCNISLIYLLCIVSIIMKQINTVYVKPEYVNLILDRLSIFLLLGNTVFKH